MDEFQAKGPFTSNISTSDALETIQTIRSQLNSLKEQEQQLRRGLGIFKIDQPPSKDIGSLEKVRGWSSHIVGKEGRTRFLDVKMCYLEFI